MRPAATGDIKKFDFVTVVIENWLLFPEDKSLLQCLDAARYHNISQLNSANRFVNIPENYSDKLWLKCGITGESS